jgi:hypothetical protein
VTSSALPSGDANCPNGGSRFTSASGDTFACNGADGTGSGQLGQEAVTAFGFGSLFLAPTNHLTDLPGLNVTLTVPADTDVYVATSGGAVTPTTSSSPAQFVVVLVIDGLVTGVSERVTIPGGDSFYASGNWSISTVIPLAPGAHTIKLQAVTIATPPGQTGLVFTNSPDGTPGALTALLLKH